MKTLSGDKQDTKTIMSMFNIPFMFYPHTEIHEKTLSGGKQCAKTTAPASQLWSYGWQAVEGQGAVDVDVHNLYKTSAEKTPAANLA